jgi:hypothetical protein
MEQCWPRTRQPTKFQETPSESSGNDSSDSDTAEEEEDEDGWESGELLEIPICPTVFIQWFSEGTKYLILSVYYLKLQFLLSYITGL